MYVVIDVQSKLSRMREVGMSCMREVLSSSKMIKNMRYNAVLKCITAGFKFDLIFNVFKFKT